MTEKAQQVAEPAFEIAGAIGIVGLLVFAILLATALLALSRPRRCDRCRFWDLEEGQAAMAQHGDFMNAAQVLAPHQMATRVTYGDDEDGNADLSKRYEDKPDIPMAAKWSDMGLCTCECESHARAVITYRGDGCDHGKRRLPVLS